MAGGGRGGVGRRGIGLGCRDERVGVVAREVVEVGTKGCRGREGGHASINFSS